MPLHYERPCMSLNGSRLRESEGTDLPAYTFVEGRVREAEGWVSGGVAVGRTIDADPALASGNLGVRAISRIYTSGFRSLAFALRLALPFSLLFQDGWAIVKCFKLCWHSLPRAPKNLDKLVRVASRPCA